MIARCARCQGTFTTDRFGIQICPHCGSELLLSDPSAPPGAPQPPEAPATPQQPEAPAAPPPPEAQAPPPAGALPPPPAPPGGGAPPPGTPGYPPPGPPPEPEQLASPFADRKAGGFLGAFFETWKLVAIHPRYFFRRVRGDQTGAAILFGVIASTVGNVIAGAYNYLSGAQATAAFEQMLERMTEEQAELFRGYLESLPTITLVQIVLTPILTVVGIYLTAAVLHLVLTLLRGANRRFDATLTVVAYASGLNLLNAVPACGAFLAVVWGLVVLVIGVGEMQRCGMGKATAAVLAPAALVCVCCCAALGLTIPAFFEGVGEAAGSGTTTL